MKKGFMDFVESVDADILCVQETKCQISQVDIETPNYYQYWNQAEKKGYSGTAIFSKTEALSARYGIGIKEHDNEGRVITLEFEKFYLVNVYTPNSQRELARLEYRMSWENAFREYILSLDSVKPVIICGDLNVAHKEIDLKNPKSNKRNAGFTQEERTKMTTFLGSGFIDTYRYFYPDEIGVYTWWSYIRNARANNAGWRIDYFIVSNALESWITDAVVLSDVMGSDHCPVSLILSNEV